LWRFARTPGPRSACARCLLVVTFVDGRPVPELPPVKPGDRLYEVDARAEPLAGLDPAAFRGADAVRLAREAGGLRVEPRPHKAFAWVNPHPRLRDGCAAVHLAEASPRLLAYAVVRSESIGAVASSYAFRASPAGGEAALLRMIAGGVGRPSLYTPLARAEAGAIGGGPLSFEARAQGAVLEGRAGGAFDRAGAFAAVVRARAEGKIMGAYVAVVAPGRRSVRPWRAIEGQTVSETMPPRDRAHSPHVAPPGAPDVVELRAADAILRVFVNGRRVLSAEDAGLGFGAYGWRALSLAASPTEPPSAVLFAPFDAYEVFAAP
jgi:hypothetical protein